jgi:hypothetical protein
LSGIISGLLGAFFPPMPEPLDEVEPGRTAVVRGRVMARDLLRSPLSGAECVYYRYTVEDWRRSGMSVLGGDGFWAVAEHDEAITEFYLQDGSTRALVSPFYARIEPRRGISARPVELGVDGRRAQELVIAPGDLVEVVGSVDRVDDLFDDGRDYRGSPNVLCLRAPPGDSILVRILQAA